ncbi:MAG: RNA 2'-phosphotransferase [Pleurocapsa sp.]
MTTISPKRLLKISKYLSYHLRHHPDKLRLKLAPGGWIEVKKLLAAAKKHKFPITQNELRYVVEQNDKQRFSFDSTGTLIRANQGHSIKIDLQLQPTIPPKILYHGTYLGAVRAILEQGLKKMNRHHVHLSQNWHTAQKVGQRRGKAVILEIDAEKMYQEGFDFYCSDNGVWLVDAVPCQYLKQLD